MSSQIHAFLHQTQTKAIVVENVHLRLFTSVADVEDTWESLEKTGKSTVYQSLTWCRAWDQSTLKQRTAETRIVLGESGSGEALFIVPLQVRKRKGARILEFLSAPLAAYGHLVCGPWCSTAQGQTWFTDHLQHILDFAGEHDLVAFMDMPADFGGFPHPFTCHFNMLSPNESLTVRLSAPFERFVETKRKPESRKNIRWRDGKLAAAGKLEFHSELEGKELAVAADELFADQGKRLAEAGINDPFGELEREFYHRILAAPTSHTKFNVFRLSLNGQGLSSIFAGLHGTSCNDLMTSLAQSPMRKFSPGDLVLRKVMALCCERQINHLDFGIGEHEYKRQWSDGEVILHHMIRARTVRGLFVSLAIYGEQKMRREIKTRPTLRNLYFNMRRKLYGKPPEKTA